MPYLAMISLQSSKLSACRPVHHPQGHCMHLPHRLTVYPWRVNKTYLHQVSSPVLHLDFTQPACESCGCQTPTPRRIRTCFPRRRPVLTRSVFSRGATDRQIPSQNGTDRSQGAQNKVPRVRSCAEQPARDNTISLVTVPPGVHRDLDPVRNKR
jgi:hypothetical protein